MANRTKNRPKEDSDRVAAPPDDDALRQEIALRAYYRYCGRGRVDGFDMEDWFAAEREVIPERATTTTDAD